MDALEEVRGGRSNLRFDRLWLGVTEGAGLHTMGGMRWIQGVLVVILITGAAAWGGENATLSFVVVRDYNGKPVRNASVVMHPVKKNGKQSRGGLELKTDSEGKTSFEGVPYGPLRVQVLAPGFQTFGEDYEIDKPTMEITVKLKRPVGQYSIYEDHPENKKDDKKGEDPKPNDEKKPN